MLGRFLEISVHAPAIRESLAFYESLGFVQAHVGETWNHPYAVVTDGRLYLGLHGAEMQTPLLTFVQPQLAERVGDLERLGIERLEEAHLGDEVFHRAAFRDPSGQTVRLLEARTFSPPQLERPVDSFCGYFTEFGMPVRDSAPGREFWEPLGFVAMEEELRPFARTALASDLINLGLYRTRALRGPVLTFEDAEMRERIARLRERGLKLTDEMPDGLDASANAVLEAPEGTRLLLLESER